MLPFFTKLPPCLIGMAGVGGRGSELSARRPRPHLRLPDWQVIEDRFDFRVDGHESMNWRMPDGTDQAMLAHFLEVHPRQRIVYAYTTRTNDVPISSSLVMVEFDGRGGKTIMTFTEQAVFSNPRHGDTRESGTGIGFLRLQEIMRDMPEGA